MPGTARRDETPGSTNLSQDLGWAALLLLHLLALLLAAVRAQAGQCTRQGEAAAGARGRAVRPEVARDAATLLEGQRAIWLAAEAHLLPSARGAGEAVRVGGRRAHGTARGVVKRRAPREVARGHVHV